MTDARTEYEQAIESAHSACQRAQDDAWAKLGTELDTAWYRYQVRTGMVTVPEHQETEVSDDRESPSTGLAGSGPGDGDREPIPGPDDKSGTRESAEEGSDN